MSGSPKIRSFTAALGLGAVLAAGCVTDKELAPKGEVDEAGPPGTPTGAPRDGKADGAAVIPLRIESAHPYANDLAQTFRVDLTAVVASCARGAVRLHFAQLRTEAGYDFVHLDSPVDGRVQSLDGNHDDTWSEWLTTDATMHVDVVLESDDSVRRNGFVIDAVELTGTPVCPQFFVQRSCPAGSVDINPARGVCECEPEPTCVDLDDVELEHIIGGGFTGAVGGKRIHGVAGAAVRYQPGQPDEVVPVGVSDGVAVTALVRELARAGWLERSDVAESSNWSETFRVRAGAVERVFTRPQGTFSAEDAAMIARFEELFSCAGTAAPFTCGGELACVDNACIEAASCFCPANYDPVCGANGETYSNGCAAGCAHAEVAHDGACGLVGDSCGTLFGRVCDDGFKCRFGEGQYEYPFPDAGGTCVADSYCDAPVDCNGLPHIAVPGGWTCEANACGWKAGIPWRALDGWSFATAHPYGNSESAWQPLYLPADATRARLRVTARSPSRTATTSSRSTAGSTAPGRWSTATPARPARRSPRS